MRATFDKLGIVIGASLWLWQVNWWSRSIALSLIAWFGCDLFWRARWTQRYPIELKIFGCLCFLWLLMSLNWKPITLEYSQGQEERSPLTKKDILEVIKEGLSAFSKSPSQQTESETRSALLKPKPHATPVPAQEPRSKPEPPTDMPKDKGTLVLKLTPYVIVERLFVKSDNPEIRGTSLYSFGLVLYAQNNYRTAKNIRQIEITGNAPLDFGDYIGSRTMEGRVINEVEKEFIRRRPYYSLSLVTYPKGGGRVDGDGTERFIQFDLMKSNAYGARLSNVPVQDYLGYEDPATPPKKLTTEPNLKDLITFSRRDPRNFQEWQGPKLRKEIAEGTIKFAAVVDATAINIDRSNINPVQWILEKSWLQDNSAELYFQGEYGYPVDRKAVPGHDPAMRRIDPRVNPR
jgi:hypothetical protein